MGVALPKVIILTGGSTREPGGRCSEVIARSNIDVVAVIATDRCPQAIAEMTRDLLNKDAPLFYSRRPWEESEIRAVFERDVAIGINIGFDYIIDESLLAQFSLGLLNLHPSLLPLNQGCHHSFWGIREKTPLGATLHWMNEKLDQGDIIDQESFYDDGFMTAEEIQQRSESLFAILLERNLPTVLSGTAPRRKQRDGTYHSKKAIVEASTLHCGDSISVDDLLDLCRATSCKGNGFYVVRDGKRVLVRTTLEVLTEEQPRPNERQEKTS